jgi:pre-rRNA-processing protein IPI1
MTKSNKHKNERKKDFKKEKLKVGKARPKNTNATDTSFAAKCTQLSNEHERCKTHADTE